MTEADKMLLLRRQIEAALSGLAAVQLRIALAMDAMNTTHERNTHMSTIDIATVQEAVGSGWSAFVTVEEIVHIDPNGKQVIETIPTYAAERIGVEAVTQHSKSLEGLVRSVEAYEARRQAQEEANAEAVAANNARIVRKHDARLQQRAAKLSWADVAEIARLKAERGDDPSRMDAALAEIAALREEAKAHRDDPVKGA